MIGQPSDYPNELVAALARLYEKNPEVKRAWLAFYHNPERDQEGGLLIALEVAADAMTRISGETGMVFESVSKKQKYADIIRFDEKDGVSGYFKSQKPFYQKSALKQLWSKISG
jgi:hypothetical protein